MFDHTNDALFYGFMSKNSSSSYNNPSLNYLKLGEKHIYKRITQYKINL